MLDVLVERLLLKADIRVNGNRPWDMKVSDCRVFREVIMRGSLGLGEAYRKGWWDCEQLGEFSRRLHVARLDRFGRINPIALGRWLKDRFGNAAAFGRPFTTARVHYDLGNEFYSWMLDSRMVYSCAYFHQDGSGTLEEGQFRKLDLTCQKLCLEPGMEVLDIGCGFGGWAEHAATHYGVRVTGITRSAEQARYAAERCRDLPVKILLQDYRECRKSFDRIVSIGMYEHVEQKNDGAYFNCIKRCLKPNGLALVHAIGKGDGEGATDPYIRKYVFPEGMIPTRRRIHRAVDGVLHVLDWHELGPRHYAKTLDTWDANVARARVDHCLEMRKYFPDEQSRRGWHYYLCMCAGSFLAERLDVWQIVLAKDAIVGYKPRRLAD